MSVPFRPPRSPLPQDWGLQAQPKTAIAIISGKGKAMDCKFGRYIHSVHPNKSPLKIWEKRERGHIQGLSKFFEYPLLSQERLKLGTSSLAGTFTGSIRTKAHEKFGRKGSVGISRDWPNFSFKYPVLSQERVKLRTSNFVHSFLVSIRTKAHYKFREK